ncbi:antirestriction protein ArdA, partial [Klebsiella pneumoniae]|nr:antirestriction protein ArdA [Klebsiella pneumoniae]
MTSSVTVPAVYVGTYHQYNGGSIFGKWFDLTDFDDEDEFYDACRALHAAEDDPEFMFQDWEGIPSQFASESSVKWAFIEAFRQAQDEGRAAAFVAWADYTGECDYDAFDEAYCGGHCCKVSDEAAFCLIQRPYISKTLLTRRISPRGSP